MNRGVLTDIDVTPWGDVAGIAGSPSGGFDQAEEGVETLVNGQDYFDVVFADPKVDSLATPTTAWQLTEQMIVNNTDGAPLKLWPSTVVQNGGLGFRQYLSAAPNSANYKFKWAVKVVL